MDWMLDKEHFKLRLEAMLPLDEKSSATQWTGFKCATSSFF